MDAPGTPASLKPASNYRLMICALLFLITTINYMDRNILGVLKPTIQNDLHFTETDFGNIIFFFSIATPSAATPGWFSDKVGIRIGLASQRPCGAWRRPHGMVASVTGHIFARIVLGLGEGGFHLHQDHRHLVSVARSGLATGIFNSGNNIGAMLA